MLGSSRSRAGRRSKLENAENSHHVIFGETPQFRWYSEFSTLSPVSTICSRKESVRGLQTPGVLRPNSPMLRAHVQWNLSDLYLGLSLQMSYRYKFLCPACQDIRFVTFQLPCSSKLITTVPLRLENAKSTLRWGERGHKAREGGGRRSPHTRPHCPPAFPLSFSISS